MYSLCMCTVYRTNNLYLHRLFVLSRKPRPHENSKSHIRPRWNWMRTSMQERLYIQERFPIPLCSYLIFRGTHNIGAIKLLILNKTPSVCPRAPAPPTPCPVHARVSVSALGSRHTRARFSASSAVSLFIILIYFQRTELHFLKSDRLNNLLLSLVYRGWEV